MLNGGIPPPYKTLPTWDFAEGTEDKTYDQMFKQPVGVPTVSPQGRSVSNNPNIPQQHQVPFHFQQGNPVMPPSSGPSNGPHGLHSQGPHGPSHFPVPANATWIPVPYGSPCPAFLPPTGSTVLRRSPARPHETFPGWWSSVCEWRSHDGAAGIEWTLHGSPTRNDSV